MGVQVVPLCPNPLEVTFAPFSMLGLLPIFWLVELDFDAANAEANVFVPDERFSENSGPLFTNIDPTPRPYVARIRLNPVELKLKEGVALDTRVTVSFIEDWEISGSFFRKLKASNPFYHNKQIRVRRGKPDDVEGSFITEFLGRIDDLRIQRNGSVTILGKGLLTVSRKGEPKVTTGRIRADTGQLSASATKVFLADPAIETRQSFVDQYRGGSLNEGYAEPSVSEPSYIKIENEIMKYTSTSILQNEAKTPAIKVTRGQFTADGWDAGVTHDAGESVQRVIAFDDVNVVDAVISLFKTALGDDPSVASAFIDETLLGEERDTFGAGITIRGVLDEPVELKTLTKELRLVSGLIVWVDERQKLVGTFRGRINGTTITPDNQTITTVFNETAHIIEKSLSTEDGQDQRITRASIKYNRIQNDDNFKTRVITIDAAAESSTEYGEVESLEVESRFLRSDAIAFAAAARLVSEFRDGKPSVKFSLSQKDSGARVGDLIRILTAQIQKADGTEDETVLMLISRRIQQDGRFDYEGVKTTFPGEAEDCRAGWFQEGVWKLTYTPTAEFVGGDVGKVLVSSGSPTFSGTIVDFDTGAGFVWVTPIALATDTFDNAQSYTVTSGMGTGSYVTPPEADLNTGSGSIDYNSATVDQKKRTFFIKGHLLLTTTQIAPFESGDVGKTLTGSISGDSGTIREFTTTNVWVKPDDVATDLFEISEDYTLSGVGLMTATFTQSFNVSGQETSANGFFFKPNGLKMYVIGAVGDDVNEYDLSVAWDISTASFLQLKSISAQDNSPLGLFFRSDGLKMYMMGNQNDRVFEYDLSSAWDVSTLSFLQSFSISGQDTLPWGVFFKPDGTKMYVVGNAGQDINEYDLSTAWDVTSATFLQLFDVSSEEIQPTGVFFKADGTEMFVFGVDSDAVHRYLLSVAWDITSAVLFQSIDTSTEEDNGRGVFFRPDETTMFIVGAKVPASVNEYALVAGIGAGALVAPPVSGIPPSRNSKFNDGGDPYCWW